MRIETVKTSLLPPCDVDMGQGHPGTTRRGHLGSSLSACVA